MHIVFVEDNATLAKSIDQVFKQEGYVTTHFCDGAKACEWLVGNAGVYDLVMLDVLLPGMDGFSLCRALRDNGIVVPVLMLTSKNSSEDTVQGLDCGADDYLKKPFVFDELLARIRSLSRRQPRLADAVVTITPDVTVDMLSHTVVKKGEVIALTAKEFGILSYFLDHPNMVITQQALYDHVFDFADIQLSNTIEVHIKNLRKKLRTKAHELPLTTIRNAGYRYDYEK